MISNWFSFIGRAIAPMAVVLAIGFAAPAQAAPQVSEQLRVVADAQTDVTQAAWRGHRRDGYRRYGCGYRRDGYRRYGYGYRRDGYRRYGYGYRRDGYRRYGYRHNRRGYNGLAAFGAIVGGALLYDDRYERRYYQRRYYQRPNYYTRSPRNWAPEGWPRS